MASFISWGNQFYTIIRTQLNILAGAINHIEKEIIELDEQNKEV